ncbi:MAG: AgmX/PglI C-terminal domain-containing protein [Deltaproteobacteria bacterium]|nr:AgmX/PglI C-terminal domain-containing protein [Kofleriaceae bacterium]
MRVSVGLVLAASAGCAGPARPREPATPAPASEKPPAGDVNRVIASRKQNLLACYTRALAHEPEDSDLAGKLIVRFEIDAKGAIAEIAINRDASTMAHTGFEACVIGELRGLRFTDGPGVVNYPLLFDQPSR